MAGAVACLIATTGVDRSTSSAARNTAQERTGAVLRCPGARTGLEYWKAAYARHRAFLGLPGPPATVRYDCVSTIRRASEWRDRAIIERTVWEGELADRRREARMGPVEAICRVFGSYCQQALVVTRCESGRSRTPRAANGQYLGMFQMGSSERARYGHGDTPIEQARAAWRYFVASGKDWSPWSCKPW